MRLLIITPSGLEEMGGVETQHRYLLTVSSRRCWDVQLASPANSHFVNGTSFTDIKNGPVVCLYESLLKQPDQFWHSFDLCYFVPRVTSTRTSKLQVNILERCDRLGVKVLLRITSTGRLRELMFDHGWKLTSNSCIVGLLALNEAIAREIVDCGFSSKSVIPIRNGVDISLFFPACEHPSLPLKFLSVSRFTPAKRVGLLLQHWLKSSASRLGATLSIVGATRAADLADDLPSPNLVPAVNWLGACDRGKLGQVYRDNHVFVSFSRTEGMSNAMLEAMACGLPVLAPLMAHTSKLLQQQLPLLFNPANEINPFDLALNLQGQLAQFGRSNSEVVARSHTLDATEELLDIMSALASK
jgi:glycosyltransferase involved in cell wall biosynthesis